MYQLGILSTAACDDLEIGCPPVLNGRQCLDFGVLQ